MCENFVQKRLRYKTNKEQQKMQLKIQQKEKVSVFYRNTKTDE